jgi:dipeptide/tripeptide permease
VLFVVSLACILAFVFQATAEIIIAIVALGCVTAVAEHVMHSRNHP